MSKETARDKQVREGENEFEENLSMRFRYAVGNLEGRHIFGSGQYIRTC